MALVAQRVTVEDVEARPDLPPGERYEIIDGVLYATKQPSGHHQFAVASIITDLGYWNRRAKLGFVFDAPGVVLGAEQAVAPDVVWVRRRSGQRLLNDRGRITFPPDLVVEVLSPGQRNAWRDEELKLNAYARYGVQEYWIVNWRAQLVTIYRRAGETLELASVLTVDDEVTSPLLSGFSAQVADWCSPFD